MQAERTSQHLERPTFATSSMRCVSQQTCSNYNPMGGKVLVLNNVSIMVGEFIPFGTNQMLSLNHKLGVTDRVQVCSRGCTALLSR